MTAVRKRPCPACPYQQNVPSAVWTVEEYAKLVRYDAPTGEQPMGAFACHATPERHCHGWAVVHSNRGHEFELLALRFKPPEGGIPKAAVKLFASGREAAEHGCRDLLRRTLSPEARTAIERLLRYPRFRSQA